jgi:uncharacterized protein (TIGR02598 family)
MKLSNRTNSAFSLVELTLALGVAAFCLLAVFGLMPVGVQTNRNATSQTAATNILTSVVSDLRGSPPNQQPSSKYGIFRGKGNPTTVCFDGRGGWFKLTGISTVCPANYPVYRLFVQVDNTTTGTVAYPAQAYLRVTWPAAANPSATPSIRPSGSVETVTTYFIK